MRYMDGNVRAGCRITQTGVMLFRKASGRTVGLALGGRDSMVWIPSPSVIGWKIGNVAVKRGESEERGELEARRGHRKFVGMVLLVMMTGVGMFTRGKFWSMLADVTSGRKIT